MGIPHSTLSNMNSTFSTIRHDVRVPVDKFTPCGNITLVLLVVCLLPGLVLTISVTLCCTLIIIILFSIGAALMQKLLLFKSWSVSIQLLLFKPWIVTVQSLLSWHWTVIVLSHYYLDIELLLSWTVIV